MLVGQYELFWVIILKKVVIITNVNLNGNVLVTVSRVVRSWDEKMEAPTNILQSDKSRVRISYK